jgi:hypothetical protein
MANDASIWPRVHVEWLLVGGAVSRRGCAEAVAALGTAACGLANPDQAMELGAGLADAQDSVDAGPADALPPRNTLPGVPDANGEPPTPDEDGCQCRTARGALEAGALFLVALLIGRRRRSRPGEGVARRAYRMRRRRRAAAVLAAIILVACGGSGSAPADAPIDAPGDAPSDAVSDTPIDAVVALPDAPWDARLIDAGSPGILVRVLDGEVPVPGVTVLFHDAAGELIERGLTGASGELLADVPDGSMVTVVKRSPPVWLRTVREVERGDVLVFGRRHRSVIDGWITVSAPPPTPPVDSAVFTISAHCLGAESLPGGPSTLPLTMWCLPEPRSSVMAVMGMVPPGQQYYALAYMEEQGVALVPGTTIALAGSWLPAEVQTVEVTGVPVDAAFHVTKTWYRGGLPFYSTGHRLSTPGSFEVPGGGDAWRAAVSVCQATTPGCQFWYQWLTDPLVVTGDFDAERLPWVTSTAVELGLRIRATWTTDRVVPHTGAKVRVLQLDGGTLLAEWTTVVPAAPTAASTITMPELPDDLVDLWVDLGALDPATTSMVELDRTVAGSYRDLRQGVFYAEAIPGFAVPQSELSAVSVSDQIWWDQVEDSWP